MLQWRSLRGTPFSLFVLLKQLMVPEKGNEVKLYGKNNNCSSLWAVQLC